jgi:hypothetical protein
MRETASFSEKLKQIGRSPAGMVRFDLVRVARVLRFSEILSLDSAMDRGLIIQPPAVEWILAGLKTWELRGRRARIRGRIALIETPARAIRGTCRLVDCIGPLTPAELAGTIDRHRAPEEYWVGGGRYRRTYAWVLADPQPFEEPIAFRPPQGAITWVRIPPGFLPQAGFCDPDAS